MKPNRFCFLVTAFVLLSVSAKAVETQSPSSPASRPARANPALAGIDKLYIVIEPADAGPGTDGLRWKQLQTNIKTRIEKAGIAVVDPDQPGPSAKARGVPELRVKMEMVRFTDSDLYVYRTQVSLAVEARLPRRQLFFKADVWQSSPAMRAVSVQAMPNMVTRTILRQVKQFIDAWHASNLQETLQSQPQPTDPNVWYTESRKDTKLTVAAPQAKYKYLASKNSKVFHKPQCSSARRIKPGNLVYYKTRTDALRDGRRPCRLCNP